MTDSQIKEMTLKFRSGLIADRPSFGFCYFMSAGLSGLLSSCGVENSILELDVDAENYNGNDHGNCAIIEHFVLKIGDKILDATADQFKNMPKVYFGEMPSIYKIHLQ